MRMSSAEEKYKNPGLRGGVRKCDQHNGGVLEDVLRIIIYHIRAHSSHPGDTDPESSPAPHVIEQSMLGSEMVAAFVDLRALGDLQQWFDSVRLPNIKLTRNRE